MFLLLLIVLFSYSCWFVGLVFKNQQNESIYGKSGRVTDRILCFYCYWLCSVDISNCLLI